MWWAYQMSQLWPIEMFKIKFWMKRFITTSFSTIHTLKMNPRENKSICELKTDRELFHQSWTCLTFMITGHLFFVWHSFLRYWLAYQQLSGDLLVCKYVWSMHLSGALLEFVPVGAYLDLCLNHFSLLKWIWGTKLP